MMSEELVDLAERVAKATRLRNATVELNPSGTQAKIILNGSILAYIAARRKGRVRVHVRHYGREERLTCSGVQAAATAVKSSERRHARPTSNGNGSGPAHDAA